MGLWSVELALAWYGGFGERTVRSGGEVAGDGGRIGGGMIRGNG